MGCDLVVAQGVEAGGHVRGTTPRAVLLEQVLEAVSLPVVSAGGIATAAEVAAAIEAGAAAARVGTRFVAASESAAHPAYVEALVRARSAADTELTTTFCLGWPDAPHRVLASAVRAARAHAGETVGHLDGRPVPLFDVSPPTRDVEGEVAAMALYAGEGVGHVDGERPAQDLVDELVAALT